MAFDPEAQFLSTGDAIEYTPGADMLAGTVVAQPTPTLGALVGVLVNDTKSGELGALQVTGRFLFKKTDGIVMPVGASIDWDDDTNMAILVLGEFVLGKCTKTAAAGDTHVEVLLLQTQAPIVGT